MPRQRKAPEDKKTAPGNPQPLLEAIAAGTNRPDVTDPDSLTDQARKFVDIYLLTWNATKAALGAGYARSHAGQTGHTLLKDPRVMELIEQERARIRIDFRKTHEALTAFYLRVLEVDPTEIVQEVREEIGDINPFDTLEEDRDGKRKRRGKGEFAGLPSGRGMLIDSITLNDTKEGQSLTVKVFSKQAAADMLNKHVGYYGADNEQKKQAGVQIYLPDNNRGDVMEEKD